MQSRTIADTAQTLDKTSYTHTSHSFSFSLPFTIPPYPTFGEFGEARSLVVTPNLLHKRILPLSGLHPQYLRPIPAFFFLLTSI